MKKGKPNAKIEKKGWSQDLIDLYDLISQLLEVDPKKRLNAA